MRTGVYRHYKGNHYLVIGLAQHETNEPMVVYVRLYPQDERGGIPMRLRPLSEWSENVDECNGTPIRRFEYVGDAEK